MLSDEALAAFKKVWKDEFGTDVPDEHAANEAVAVLSMFDAVYRPLKQAWLDEYENEYGAHL